MPEPAIRVEGISKQYYVGVRESYSTFREALVSTFTAPLKRLRSFGRSSYRQQDTIWALKDVSFEVQPGEVIGIIGRNGAGKSTLLKILSRITEPTEGRAVIRGRVDSLLEVGTGFHPELTGRENLYLSGAILGMSRREISERFDRIVDFAGVHRFMDTPVKRYSSGMRVRLGFAVAAHLEPDILIVDEVLAVGDAEFQKKCLGRMRNVAGEGRTVLFVSHNMAAINRLCSRTILLSEGRIIVDGATSEVVKHYLSTSGGEERAEAIFDDDPAKTYQVLAVSIRHPDGRLVTRLMAVDEDFDVQVRFRLREPLSHGYCGIVIRNENAEIVFHSENRDCPESYQFSSAGIVDMTVRMPAPLLVPGRYTISTAISRVSMGAMDTANDAVGFELVDMKGPRMRRAGYVYVPLEWKGILG